MPVWGIQSHYSSSLKEGYLMDRSEAGCVLVGGSVLTWEWRRLLVGTHCPQTTADARWSWISTTAAR